MRLHPPFPIREQSEIYGDGVTEYLVDLLRIYY